MLAPDGANEIQPVIELQFRRFLHTTAQPSSSTTRFICHQCARWLLCPPSALKVAVAGAAVPAAANKGAAGAGGNGGSLRRSLSLRGLGADTVTIFEGSWRRHSTRSLDTQHVLVERRLQVMQGLPIIRIHATVSSRIIGCVAFFEGTLEAPGLNQSSQENIQA